MKVAYLLGSLSRGGTETLLLDVFRNADKADFEFIGVHRKDGPYKDDFYATKPMFIKCGPKGVRFVSYLRKLRNIIKQNKIEIVHAQQAIDAVYAHLACIRTGIKVVETFHGYDFEVWLRNRWIVKKSMDWSDAICFVSNKEKRYYLDKYGHKYADKCHVVYNGVNFDKIICKTGKSMSPNATDAPKLSLGQLVILLLYENR